MYVCGWLKRGPVGIIDSTLRDSVETFRIIKHHLECDLLPEKYTSVEEVLKQISIVQDKLVDYQEWKKIDKVERERGSKIGKIREKILTKDEMHQIIKED